MSGVNAHAIFRAPTAPEEYFHAPSRTHFNMQRHWAIPRPFQLLGTLHTSKDGCTFALDLRKSELAFLGDHMVEHPIQSLP
jgi:hypothetical protein